MARYYKYAPQQYESMFVPLPLDLFAAKLQGEQGKFDALEQASQQVQDQWRSLQVDPYDVEKRDKKIAEMKQEFSDVIDNSKGDVNRMYSELNRLNRDWNEYTTMGHGAAMSQSLATVQEARKKYDEAVAKGDKKEASRWVEFLNHYRQWGESGGTKPSEGGRYTTFSYDFGSPDFDADKWHKEIALPGWNANKESYKRGVGDYVTAESMEILDANRVYNGLYGDLSTREDFEKTTNNKFRYYTKDLDARGMVNVALNGYDGNSGLIAMRDGYIKKADELEKAGKKDEAAKYKAQAEYFDSRVNAITTAASFEDAVGTATNEAYKVFKESEIQNTMALAMEKLPYVKQSWSELTRTPESDMRVAKYAYDLENKAKPAMSVNTSTKDTSDALSMFKDFYEQAQTDKEGAYKNIVTAGLQLVKDKKLSEQDLTSIYNATLAKMPEGATYEETVIEMARGAAASKSVGDYNKANGTNLDADAYARWKADAVTDVINYQVGQVKEYAVNNFIGTTMDNVMTDDMLNVVEYAFKNNPDIWAMLGKANIPSELADIDWGSMSKDEQKSALKALAGANPTDFLTIYANGGGDINGLVQVMYGQAVTAADGPIADLNKEYTTAFANMTEQQLSDMGVLEGLDEIYKPSEGGKVKSATFVKNPLGFGTGFVELTIADKDGNTTKKVVDVSKSTDAANIALHYWSNQLNDWSSNPDAASNTVIQQQIDKARTIRGSLITNNTLSPIVGDRGMTQVAKSNITGKQYKVVPVKFMGKTEYQLYEIVAGTEKPVINRYSKNSYENIEAVNAQISDYEWDDDYTGANPTGQKKVIKDQNQEPEN
jgi:hypothetical protein